ncbi:MAG: thiamine phosphate synthase [Mycetocola sp.]
MSARIPAGSLASYLVTDTALCGDRGVVATVEQAIAGGVRTVQLRDKSAPLRDLYALLLRLAEVTDGRATLLIDDRVDVFLAARAAGAAVDGVHVGQSDLPAVQTRSIIGPDAILGLSAATPEQITAASAQDVDYLGIGAIHATSTKPDHPTPLGVGGFASLRALTDLPCVAIGGITVDDAAPLARAGADGVAVVSLICASANPEAAARDLTTRFAQGVR